MQHVELFCTTSRLVFGVGAIQKLAKEIQRLGKKRILLISDKGLVTTGIVTSVDQQLQKAGYATALFDSVQADPRYETIDASLSALKKHKADVILGIGGGSPLDIAKVTSIMATNTGSVRNYFGIDLVPNPGLPVVLVPTTAGTGSEVTPIAILSDEKAKLKSGIVSPYLFPEVALLDPELTLGLPPAITAAAGMDAFIHALEAYTSINANPMTDLLAAEAISLLSANIRTAYANGRNLPARTAMLRGALLAGMSFANAGVTAVHAFAYPIGAEFHIPHGIANTIMLLPVLRFNLVANMARFAAIGRFMGLNAKEFTMREAAFATLTILKELAEDLNVPQRLSQYGIKEQHIPALAEDVMKVTRLLANNPRNVTLEDAKTIYREAL